MASIFFKNQELYCEAREGADLLQVYKQHPSLPMKFGCCEGKCGVCRIKVIEGGQHLSRLTKQERETLAACQLDSPPYRLACQCAILADVVIES